MKLNSAAVGFALMTSTQMAIATIVGIQGTMSNFDVFNETGVNAYGAEIELEGVHAADVTRTYPSHFNTMTATEYTSGSTFGTRLLFSGYNFTADGFVIPRAGQNTNGHFAVNLPGCEHFGFSLRAQQSRTAYYWLDQSMHRINAAPMTIPMPTWTFQPAVGANPPVVQAVLLPPPPPLQVLYPDAVWVKTYVTELTRQVDLDELISSPPSANGVAPQLPSEVEAEWELLPGDSPLPQPDIQLAERDQSILRRYEFFRYTGGYDEVHLPTSPFTGGTPDPAELGGFIAANMVAANLLVGCLADFNQDGLVNADDLSTYITCYFTEATTPGACPQAEFNGDGDLNADDLSDYITAYFAGGC